jgi:hypothetical protein
MDHVRIEQATKPSTNSTADHLMADGYRIFRTEMSSRSGKVRCRFRSKAITPQPHL